ncbi:MAG: hypothetical protein AAGJ90_19765 [Pseudomonadota bacterium]
MSRGLGKAQLAIIEAMQHTNEDDHYWYDVRQLMELTSKAQQSINRALSNLIERGMVIREKYKFEPYGGGTTRWCWVYMLEDKRGKQSEIDKRKEENLLADQARARELGYDDYCQYLAAKMFGNL